MSLSSNPAFKAKNPLTSCIFLSLTLLITHNGPLFVLILPLKYFTWHACMLSNVQLFATSWIVACRALLSMEFSRQKYWSGLPLPISGDLSDPGIELVSGLTGRVFTTALQYLLFCNKAIISWQNCDYFNITVPSTSQVLN